ncbi:hypothetical protein VTN77DRAFT_4267 [Rasamsonia byssochlamydoides]|uniref:uncharacterized protein n=1 Tax=Rasamsonia byssochlamydoides TaxID=89139 RepID=UPI003744A981
MSALPGKSTPASASNASLRLEKSHPGVRRSTPDSEALASSEDEAEQHQQTPTAPSAPVPKPARRTSWLNEVPQSLPRKASLTTGGPLSSTGSNPSTPAADQSPWATTTSPGLSGSISWGHGGSSFPWGTGIWNTESRKEPPPRLSELSLSPTMPNPPNTSTSAADEILSPTARTAAGDSSIPFTIPLHPTPKTYRSQSYSVGQLDPETVKLMAAKAASHYNTGRGRNGSQYTGLQHRSSRPSLLGELGHDSALLGQVREDDDDEDNANSDGGYPYASNQARTIEQLTRENALLRQAAGQLDSARLRDRAASSASANSGYSMAGGVHNLHRIRGSVPEESDLAVEDLDELGDIHAGYSNIRSNTRRRFSEHSGNLEKQFPTFASLENRPLENIKRAHWQTSLGFGSISELPQSRRHSFADIPPRHASISSIGESQSHIGGVNSRSGLGDREEGYANIMDGTLTTTPGENPSYFSGREHLRAGADQLPASAMPTSLHQAYNMPTSFGRQQAGLTQPHQNQLLYIVTFKCHRADVFYIQEDTGLQVKPGDLVIVEADRGTDLGTIQHANVSWQKARELKEQYAEEHYKWLMMFSRQAQNGASNVVNHNRSGMGSTGSHGAHESQTEIKPKLIKRLAQNHEIMTLRDKEGNEAKAKRVCQQKVAEHRLNMEILDAEFQMDWKKLTFYYFADSYINFNPLVTDLFKIYKTRIWMSAINPASFATPHAGLPPPGASALGYGQETASDRRHQHDHRGYNLPQLSTAPGNLRDPLDPQKDIASNPVGVLRNAYMDPYQSFGPAGRQPEMGFAHVPHNDPFSSYPSTGYGMLESGVSDYTAANNAGSINGQRINPSQGDWVNRFQGLSLGS